MSKPAQMARTPRSVQAMRDAATAFLASLGEEQQTRAVAPFDTVDHREWTYLPGPRPGLAFEDMTVNQRQVALRLLDSGLSARAAAEARDIMSLEDVLAVIEAAEGGSQFRRDPLCYWFRILGDPHGAGPWGWRVNGHHVAVHVTVVQDTVAVTPQFFGANPAVVPTGERAGHRALPQEEDLARDLLGRLESAQLSVAIVDPVAPWDIQTRHDPVADVDVVPHGLRYTDMDNQQQRMLSGLIRHYVDRMRTELADVAWKRITDAGLDDVTFAWAGGQLRGDGHYYAVRGPNFLLEYDNTQNNANHVHTVWRDRDNDWGADLLAAHYSAHHSQNVAG